MESGWQQRRALAAALRAVVLLVPVVASVAVGVLAHRLLPMPTTIPGALLRAAGILLVSLPTLAFVDAVARRFLPLTVLLQLSLVFPDQTPSRFKLALKAGSGRRMARAVDEAKANGLADEPAAAAEQLVLLATAIGDHDRRTRGHSERVRLYAELIGEGMGLSAAERAKLQWAALIHDIGKITVPPEILNKKGKPDADEWAILQGHPGAGEAFVEPVAEWLGEWVHAIGGHHEKWDGSGYPRGLAGTDIPRSAAIVAVADSFEVMTAVRSYKKAMSLADARRELTRCAGSHFSPEVVRGFLNLSIGDLRRSMGVLAALAHLPLLGRVSTAASYAPDTISTAVTMTTSAATAGAGAVVATAGAGAMVVTAAVTVSVPATAQLATPAPAPASVVVMAPASAELPFEPVAAEPMTVKARAAAVVVAPATTTTTIRVTPTTTTEAPRPRPAPERHRSAPAVETHDTVELVASPPTTAVADELTVTTSGDAGHATVDAPPTATATTTVPSRGHGNPGHDDVEDADEQSSGGNGNHEPVASAAPSAPPADHGHGNDDDSGGNGNSSEHGHANDNAGNGNAGGTGNGRGHGNGRGRTKG
jgi:hypothetical protein